MVLEFGFHQEALEPSSYATLIVSDSVVGWQVRLGWCFLCEAVLSRRKIGNSFGISDTQKGGVIEKISHIRLIENQI